MIDALCGRPAGAGELYAVLVLIAEWCNMLWGSPVYPPALCSTQEFYG